MTGRKPIHFGVFLGAGSVISITAGYIILFSEATNKESMKLFLWIGVLFILIGLIKLLIKVISKIPEKEKRFEEKLAGIDKIDKMEKNLNKRAENNINKEIIYCPRCGTPNYRISNYCHMCGTRLK